MRLPTLANFASASQCHLESNAPADVSITNLHNYALYRTGMLCIAMQSLVCVRFIELHAKPAKTTYGLSNWFLKIEKDLKLNNFGNVSNVDFVSKSKIFSLHAYYRMIMVSVF